jgi:hypothetical protein
MENEGWDSRIKFPVSTRLYIPTPPHQGMCVEIAGVCCEADTGKMRGEVRHSASEVKTPSGGR